MKANATLPLAGSAPDRLGPKTKVMFVHPWAKTATKADSFSLSDGAKSHGQILKEYLDWQAIK